MLRQILLPLAFATLAACQTTTGGVASPNAEPGTASVEPADAALLFASVCAETGASHDAASAQLATLPFRQNSRTGTWYHQNLNLSFKLVTDGGGQACSMVVGAKSDPTLMLAATASGNPVSISVRDAGRIDGANYYQALATAS